MNSMIGVNCLEDKAWDLVGYDWNFGQLSFNNDSRFTSTGSYIMQPEHAHGSRLPDLQNSRR